ncbi:MAG TPA: HEAT repeat domain-containing protein [Vicinamibacterales bacterium]|nr:HEAT repeat domain-containing protein [Vicinamibacterales bacterium]
MRYRAWAVCVSLAASACATAPPKPPAAPSITAEQKMSWMLRLEDQRILRAPAPPPPPPVVTPPPRRSRNAPPPVAAPLPDLATLVADTDPRIRRRAALAVGRVGLPEGGALLQPLLKDTDPDVRQMAAFALGLLADKSAIPALTAALQDPEPRVRGRAAEALGLIGDTGSAAAVGDMVSAYVKAGAIAALSPDDERWPVTPEADAVRLGLFALVRQKAFEPLTAAIVDGSGRVSGWWPVAYALQRIGDPRAVPALKQLIATPGRYTRAFAARGLGAYRDVSSVPALRAMIDEARGDVGVTVSAVRALAQIGAPDGAQAILALLSAERVDPNLRLEAVAALGTLKSADALPYILDLVTDDWPTLRAAAIRAAAAIDPEGLPTLLSGMEPDPHWIVRAAIADVLGSLPGELAILRLRPMLEDQDKRVVAPVIDSLVRVKAPGLDAVLMTHLKNPDPGVRSAAARAIGRLRPAGGAAALRDAYRASQDPALSDARLAALEALVRYGAGEALETVKSALADSDWALRLRAAALLRELDPSAETAQAIRPVPGSPIVRYDAPELLSPAVSPHAFIETAKGTIEIELAVLDAPQTVQNFIALARRNYFNGLQVHRVVPHFVVQDGDPRGDGSGGPGYSIRDELNDRPFIRGTIGMALSGPDTGGSQYFIAHAPSPHLDAKYTVFGHVVNGLDVVDRIQQLDVIERVRIWDGKELK